ncbi:hypothetical protein FIM10_01845 [Sphingomonadales bacterium 56]|uniref:hypothetical protein n=1 Tax=unclassified Sphingobium TaxID=2611147 RepID=UPI00191891B3|nr:MULTISPECIES: hypothetical protein [unclassified Sphingobium]MBY2927426.1 hypothetical protein [Sphingomonadales bacterium 56]MBY2957494.1 hypothetical protein [Sphingomonadales bacterium 58]MBY2957537.1 hypothetical protein [Sphingomonadales bacterium 58]CAD7335167.1 hypothetical protein SPHS8_00371 [Sphingobium sp. S8]CAD7335186.1 hypothetical protein SPHS6_00371 [Sphingobium sp. S6]
MDFDAGGAAGLLGDGGTGGDGGAGGAADPNAQQQGDGGQGGAGEGGGDGGQGGGDGADLPEWAKGLSGDGGENDAPSNRDWVKAKGFKDLDGVVKSLRDTERALRDSGRVKVPGDSAGAEELAAFHKAIGVPDDAKGYEVSLPETNGGLELNTDLIGKLAEIAHAAGTPKAAFEQLANAYVEHQVTEHLAEVQKQDELAQAKLKEWGSDKDARLADCQAAQRALGIDRVMVAQLQSAWGADKTLDFLAKIGGGIAEDTLITGGTGRFGVTAAEAQRELDAIKNDPARASKASVPGTSDNLRWKQLLNVVANGRAQQ